jgi:hypothetical protein
MSALGDLGPSATVMLDKIAEAVPVQWDRLTEDGARLSIYGWIPKACAVCEGEAKRWPAGVDPLDPQNEPEVCPACDGEGTDGTGRADFLLVRFEPHFQPGHLSATYFTSSAEHSKAVGTAIWGSAADDLHIDCQRVEDALPDVKAAIRLDGDEG